MSIQSETSRIQYTGSGTLYPVPFYFFDNSDLVVVATKDGIDTVLTYGPNYSVTGAGDEDGGNVTTAVPYDGTYEITIFREVEAIQLTRYLEGASFPATSHERALDRLTMIAQQISRNVARSVRLRESDGDLAVATKVALSLFGLDGLGNPIFRTADEVVSFLNLTTQIFDRPMMTFADAGERAAAVPNFTGQLGTQRDTLAIYISTGTAAGNWTLFLNAAGSITTAMLATNVLSADALGLGKMADGFLSADAAGRAKMANQFVTFAKMQNIATSRLLGRVTGGSGSPEEIALATSLTFSGGVLGVTNPAGVIQTFYKDSAAASVITTPNMVADDTIPRQSSPAEGTEIFNQSITPTSASNKVLVRFHSQGQIASGGNPVIMALFRDSAPDAIAAALVTPYAADYSVPFVLEFLDSPATTSPTLYSVRIGPSGGTTLTLNSAAGTGRKLGGVQKSSFIVQEIKG